MGVKRNRVTIISPSFLGGGAEKIAINLANYYASVGQEVSLIVLSSKGPYASQLSPSVKVNALNTRGRYVFFKLYKILKKDSSDVIFSVIRDTNVIVGAIGYFLKLPLVFREANTMDSIEEMPFYKGVLYKSLMKRSYKKANLIIANSSDTKKDLIAHKITESNKITVIGNPVLPAQEDALMASEPAHPWFDKEKFDLVLNVGRLHRQKNQEFLLYSFSELYKENNRARLIVLGEGGLQSHLNRLAKLLGIEAVIEIVPFQNNPFVFYKAASVFALTSSWEGFGNVLVEAMWCKTPVIALDCPGGPKSILNNGEFGHLLSTDDPAVFAAQISNILTSDNLDAIERAYQRSLEYSVPAIASLYYEQATDQPIK
ncbi:glycosyltransferase [Marinomonas sp. NPDC078689]|uniref:glycosyltransferase n=1 Tax=Marinomonas sp. NPDC078689 TaxID=3364147 RepID=UPI0037C5A5E1